MAASTEAHIDLQNAVGRCLDEGDPAEEVVYFVDTFIADWEEENAD
jgi:hypothetical protein